MYDDGTLSNGIEHEVLGIVYRYEHERIMIHPKLLLGVCSFYTNSEYLYLKKKDANLVKAISFVANEHPQDHFIIVPDISVGYKVWKRIIFSLDMDGSFY